MLTNRKTLAEWLHDNYEDIAKNKNWNTQKNCKVPFDKLPKENKQTMLELADRILVLFNENDMIADLTDEQQIYITLIANLVNKLVDENIITKFQRGQIHNYLIKTPKNEKL